MRQQNFKNIRPFLNTNEKKPKVALIAETGFDPQFHAEVTRKLAAQGYEVDVLAAREGLIEADMGRGAGISFPIAAHIADVNPSNYDALVITGGERSISTLSQDNDVRRFVGAFLKLDRPVLAFCDGSLLLALGSETPVEVAASPDMRSDIEAAGAIWRQDSAAVDGKVITVREDGEWQLATEAFCKLLSA